MAGSDEGGGLEGTDDREETPPPLTKEQIKGHVSALKSLIKSHNRKNKGDPIRLNFETEDTEFAGPEYKIPNNIKLYDGTTDPEDHLSRFASAANSREWPMLVWYRMFQQTLDGSARGWIEHLPPDNINKWVDLREAFAARFSVRRAYFKEPREITKIIRRANESLTAFKERWTMGTGFIMVVPKIMKISSFMDSIKSPELAKHFFEKVPTTVNEIMERSDDFVRSKEAYASTELPKGETGEYRGRDTYRLNRPRDDRAQYPPPRGKYNRRVTPVLLLDSLTKRPKEILATKTQLRLPIPRPMLNPLRSGNTDQYCDYHQEKDHYTNDCIQLGKQLEMALESRKLNHLDKKRKIRETTKSWMDIPITFLAIFTEDIFEEPLIVEAEVEGYLVKRVYVDEGSSVEVMFEHCFENLNPKIKAGLRETQTDLVGFSGEISKPLEKIELEMCFGMPGLKTLRAIPSTIHAMMKFLTPKGVATLVTRMLIIAEYRRLEKKQMVKEVSPKEKGEVTVTKEVLVNPSFPYQPVTIGRRLPEAGRDQLKCLLKDNMEFFAWEPADMTGVPRRIIEHALNVNPSLDPVRQKRRTFSIEKSRVVTNEVVEWVKAGIVRPVKYLTYISNPVLVKKGDGTWRMCIDFKNLNSACPKDYYPLPNINCKAGRLNLPVPNRKELGGICGRHEMSLLSGGWKVSRIHGNIRRNQSEPQKDKGFGRPSTHEAEEAFQQMKKLIMDLPSLTPPREKETLYAYLAVSAEAVSAVLLTDRKGRQCPVQYVSRTLIEAERNYSLMEKLALALIHMTRILRRYFEAHPVKVITDQLIKNILNNTEISEKIEKYDVELGAYNITFIPRNAMKGQVLADFHSEAPEGEKEELYFRMPKVPLEKDNTESWTLFTDEASSPKGSGAGLVLIGPSGIEYTSALRLTFPSTNNEAEYEAFLAGLRIARQMNISNIEVKVESKLVASRINGIYEASKDVPGLSKTLMTSIMAPWPFYQWGMDILGPLPPVRGGAKFVIVAIEYFTKWIEAKPLVKITSKEVIRFVMDNIICRFGLPRIMVTDNGAQLVNDPFKIWCGRFEIHQMNTTVARPQVNGLVERANRSLMEGIKTCLGREKSGWVDELPNILWALILAEIGIPTYRTLMIREEYNEEDMRLNLDLLQERRETAVVREARYKTNMEQYYNKKVRLTGFRPGEFVF
nr:hypothetical protein [Tanacetum cinerariifolium]